MAETEIERLIALYKTECDSWLVKMLEQSKENYSETVEKLCASMYWTFQTPEINFTEYLSFLEPSVITEKITSRQYDEHSGKKRFTFNITKESGKTAWVIKKRGEAVLYVTMYCDKSVGMLGGNWSATVFGYKDFEVFLDKAID